jgi:paraquat-inducible protein B
MPESNPPDPVVEAAEPETGRRISAVWLVPLLALILALAVAWRTYSERGPMIEILFDDASGIEEGQTSLRFRNVNVGLVEDLSFTPYPAAISTPLMINDTYTTCGSSTYTVSDAPAAIGRG